MAFYPEIPGLRVDVSTGSDDFRIRWHKANQQAYARKEGIILPAGDHILTDQITIPNGVRFIRGEPGCRIICDGGGSKRVSVLFRNVFGITVEGIEFVQKNPSDNQEAILYFIDGGASEVKRCTFHDVSQGAAIFISARERDAMGFLIEDCKADGPVLDGAKQIGPIMYRVEASGDTNSPSELWRRSKQGRAYKAYPCGVTFRRCSSTGAYYGFGFSGAKGPILDGCQASSGVRGISLQDGVVDALVTGCVVQDNHSGGIHLAYTGNGNRIIGNTVTSSKAVGEGLIQAYCGVTNTLIQGNTLEVSGEANPRWMLYVGPHAHGTLLVDNVLKGHWARAAIAIEDGWPNDTQLKPSRSYGNRNQWSWSSFATEALQRVRVSGNMVRNDLRGVPVGWQCGMTGLAGERDIVSDLPLEAGGMHPANP